MGFKRNGKAHKIFSIYLLLILITEVSVDMFAAFGINNHFFATYILFIALILLSCFFYFLFDSIGSVKKEVIKYCSSLVAVALLIQYSLKPSMYFTFNSVGLLVVYCLIVVYAVLYLFELISKQLPFRYATIGIVIYHFSSILIFVGGSYIAKLPRDLSLIIWSINAALFIAYQLLILWEWKQTFYQKITRQG